MRVVFFGSGAFGLPTLDAIAHRHELTGVVTQPDRPAGRGGKLTPTPIGAWAGEHLGGVSLFKPEDVNAIAGDVRALDADAWVVIAFGQKLGRELLADRFAVNLHASLLPRWRGAAPINWAILAGDAETGNSVITLADRMDAGLVLGQSHRPIEPHQTAGELHDLLSEDGPGLVLRVLDEHESGSLDPREQDEALVTHARKLRKEDGRIAWDTDAEEIRRRVHGLTPWPGAFARLVEEPLKLLRVETGEARAESDPGTLLDADAGLVACARGTTLRVLEAQRPGKRAMSWSEIQNGLRLGAGARLEDGS